MATSPRELVLMVSTANTGTQYITTVNSRNMAANKKTDSGKLELNKYDPKVRKVVLFKQAKASGKKKK